MPDWPPPQTLEKTSVDYRFNVKKRLVHIQHLDGPGGGPVVVLNLVKAFNSEYDITVLHGGSGLLATECKKMGVRTIQIPMETLKKSLWGVWHLVGHLSILKPDIAVLHGQWAGPVGAVACKLAGVKNAIYVAHWPAFYHTGNIYRSVRGALAERIPCALSKKIVTLSNGNRREYLSRGMAGPQKLVLINNSILPYLSPSEETERIKGKMSEHSRGPNVIFVGRMDEQKRPDYLIQMWGEISEQDRGEAHLWIIGDGPLKKATEELCRTLRVEKSVTFLGSRSDARLWIAAADIVILTSTFEGHALVPLEAMASAKPVAAFAADGVTDSVVHGETGVLAPIGDTKALGNSLIQLLRSPSLRASMGKSGLNLCQTKFSQDSWIQSYQKLFRDILSH